MHIVRHDCSFRTDQGRSIYIIALPHPKGCYVLDDGLYTVRTGNHDVHVKSQSIPLLGQRFLSEFTAVRLAFSISTNRHDKAQRSVVKDRVILPSTYR